MALIFVPITDEVHGLVVAGLGYIQFILTVHASFQVGKYTWVLLLALCAMIQEEDRL